MRYTVILVPDEKAGFGVFVPALPGCVSVGRTREEALDHVRHAMRGWLESEAEQGRGPLVETRDVVVASVRETLEIIEEMDEAGEVPAEWGYRLELAPVEIPVPVSA